MAESVKARYSGGVIVPKEALDIEEGANLSITIDVQPPLSDEERIKLTKSAAGSWKGSRDPAELKRMIYEARLSGSRAQPGS